MSTQAKGFSVSVGKQAGATSVFEKQPSPVSQNGEEGVSELPTQPDEKLPSKTWGVFFRLYCVAGGLDQRKEPSGVPPAPICLIRATWQQVEKAASNTQASKPKARPPGGSRT